MYVCCLVIMKEQCVIACHVQVSSLKTSGFFAHKLHACIWPCHSPLYCKPEHGQGCGAELPFLEKLPVDSSVSDSSGVRENTAYIVRILHVRTLPQHSR